MKLTTLKPQDKRPHIPDPLAFIIYRLLPIACLSAFVYFTRERYGAFLDDDNFGWGYFLAISLLSGWAAIVTSPKLLENEDYIISRHLTPFEKLSRVRVFLESFGETRSAKFPFGLRKRSWTLEQRKKEVQLQKERLAVYLSGSRQGIPPCLSLREHFYVQMTWFTTKACLLRIFAPIIGSWDDVLGCFTYQNIHHLVSFSCLFTLVTLLSYRIDLLSCRYITLRIIGESIRYSCGTIDQKKATENKRTELEWWIEGLLREDGDSFELEEERKRVIIAPIQKMVCETHSGRNGGYIRWQIESVKGVTNHV